MSENLILTTGIYDLIKDVVRRKRVTIKEEELLLNELKYAKQVRRKQLPEDIVTVNRRVTIKDHTENTEKQYLFVSSDKARPTKGKHPIFSDIGLAIVGRKSGDVINWPFKSGEKIIEIVDVEIV